MDQNFTDHANLHLTHRLAGIEHQEGCNICRPAHQEGEES